jgi:voltage-gated potassium channel
MNKMLFKIIHFTKLIGKLVVSVPFLTISFFGNAIVFLFATIMFFIEKDINPKMASFIDALWWSFSTTTTVGYGDIIPLTVPGKIVGMVLMLIGVAVFGIYTALFARAIIDDEIYME